ncbi:hypothetical protein BofuT4_P082420.1 [Botrytis cinerea T4]|uniref:Uncharacterized protein n=1 Tax=Botryotinia fuckeliana (strain T4) TaxID=999810 RepID=G2YKD5_BOTF4|nr:hypothetical protein BofuT4_P082420.1 [Botrytis cinerea T4]
MIQDQSRRTFWAQRSLLIGGFLQSTTTSNKYKNAFTKSMPSAVRGTQPSKKYKLRKKAGWGGRNCRKSASSRRSIVNEEVCGGWYRHTSSIPAPTTELRTSNANGSSDVYDVTLLLANSLHNRPEVLHLRKYTEIYRR